MPVTGDLLTIGGALLTGGALFGGFAMIVRRTDAKLEEHLKSCALYQRDVLDRLARIETLLEKG